MFISILICAVQSIVFLVLEFEKVYLGNIPSAESYEKSFMHRDLISHIVVTE